MGRLFLILLFVSIFTFVSCKNSKSKTEDVMDVTVVDDKPYFPGGHSAMINFISRKIKYPEAARAADIEGDVIVSFMIDKEGKVKSVDLKKSVHKALDKEAMRVVKLMPKWEPGRVDGKPVIVSMEIPISFKLHP